MCISLSRSSQERAVRSDAFQGYYQTRQFDQILFCSKQMQKAAKGAAFSRHCDFFAVGAAEYPATRLVSFPRR
jgi:hypothetical protein